MIFSRHINKSVKYINQVTSEIQELYRYNYNIIIDECNINKIELIIMFDKDTSLYILDLASNDIKHNLSSYYLSSCCFSMEKKIVIYLKSIL
jgi:hypothetical protein